MRQKYNVLVLNVVIEGAHCDNIVALAEDYGNHSGM